jgi:hypothetical protein
MGSGCTTVWLGNGPSIVRRSVVDEEPSLATREEVIDEVYGAGGGGLKKHLRW